MRPIECERCGGAELLTVARVVERGRDGWHELGRFHELDPMSVVVCCGCSHLVWYVRPTVGVPERNQRSRRVSDERLHCGDCGGTTHLLVAQLEESTTDGHPPFVPLAVMRDNVAERGGRFAVVVCDGCGRAEWFACDVRLAGKNTNGECRRCRAAALRMVQPLREDGGKPLPVAVVDGKPRGELEVTWCDACGACEWRAHRIADILVDGKEVVRTFEARERVPMAGGPYR